MITSKKILLKKNSKIAEICFALVLFALFLILLTGVVSAVQVCRNDSDFNPNNGEIFTVGNTFEEVYNFVKSKAPGLGNCGDGEDAMMLAKVSWTTGSCSQLSVNQLDPTVTKICNLAGYRDPYTYSSMFNADGGRCNWFSPADNCNWYWTGSAWQFSNSNNGANKFGERWITKLTCINKLPGLPECIEVDCASNSDCDDDNLYTEDKCINPGETSSYCDYNIIKCLSDNDCGFTGFTGKEFCSNNDVFKDYKKSKCINFGTIASYCNITTTPTFLKDCEETSCGNYESNYCKNNNVYHSRVCNDKGCAIGACYSTLSVDEKLVETCNYGCLGGVCKSQPPECTTDANCGPLQICSNNHCVNVICKTNTDCNDNNAHTEDKCLNPGTLNSTCQHNAIRCLNSAECGTNGFLNQLSCKNNNVFDKYITYTCLNAGLTSSSCTNSTCDTQKTVCSNGCTNGVCNEEPEPECTDDSDCHARSPSEKYCKDNNVYQDVYEPKCDNEECSYNTTVKLVKTCSKGCNNGLCLGSFPIEEDNPETVNLGYFESADYSFLNKTSDSVSLTPVDVQIKTTSTNYNYLWIILLIILIVLFLVILLVVLLNL